MDNIKPEIKFKLARVLGLSDATFIGIGAIIGGGIFTLTGMALSLAGPSLILVIALNGFIAFMTALAYAELGSTFPEAGGGFIWVRKGLGNLAGHLSGWISWFAHAVACGLYALSFGFYFGTILFSLILPAFGINVSFSEGGLFQKIVAMSMILLVGWINFRGVSGTGKLGKIIVYCEILVLSAFAAFGLISFFKEPDIAASFTPLLPMGIFGLFSAMGLMYIGFEGTEIIVQSGEELKNPKKNMPRAIFLSLGVICLLYLLTIFSALAGVRGEAPSWQILSGAGQGALVKASSFFMPGFEWIIMLGGLLAAGAALNATVFSSSHVSFAMGRAGNLPNFLAKIHPKNKTPYIAVVISTLLVLFAAAFLPLKDVAAITDLLFIFLFAQLHLALIALRKRLPNVERPFKVPFYPIPSIIAIVAYAVLIYQFFHISPIGLMVALFWILSGLLIYFAYSKPVEEEKIEKEIIFEEKVRVTEKKKKRILLPFRADPNWKNILQLAIALAKEKEAEIHLLHVKKIPHPLPLTLRPEELEEEKQLLDEALNLIRASGVNANAILMASRRISQAVMEMIQKEDPDLLILHWKGFTNMVGTRPKIFGGKLDAILRQANCDLIVAQINNLSDLKNILLPSMAGASKFQNQLTGEVAKTIAETFEGKIHLSLVTAEKHTEKLHPEEKIEENISSLGIPPHISINGDVLYAESSSPRSIAYQIIQKSQDFGCILLSSAREKIFSEMAFGSIPEIVTRNSSRSIILVKHHQTILKPLISYLRSKIKI